MKELFVHIGAHKSASTTIQRNLRENSEVLSNMYGITYLDSLEIHPSDLVKHFRRLARGDLDSDLRYNESVTRAKLALEKIVSQSDNEKIVLSWEGFLGHSSLDKYGGIYSHSGQVADSLKKVFEGYRTRILIVVRKQDSFIESCYLQQIKENRSLEFQEFTEKIDIDKMSWLKVVNDLMLHFKDGVVVCPFEYIKNVRGARGFIEYCLSSLLNVEFDAEYFKMKEKTNSSFSNMGVEVSLKLLPSISEKNRPLVSKILFSEFSSSKYGKATFFNQFERNLIENLVNTDNDLLFKNFFVNKIGARTFDLGIVKESWEK